MRERVCDVAIQCGDDLGEISEMLIVVNNSANDIVAYQFASNILQSYKAEVTILNFCQGENETLKQFVQSLNILGNKAAVIQGLIDSRPRINCLQNRTITPKQC